MMRQMSAAMTDLMMAAQNWMALSESQGHEAITQTIRAMLDGHIGAREGVILRP
jgi:type IV secretory pathway VirB2 component (pilin)